MFSIDDAQLFCGTPIDFGICYVFPLTLREIIDLGPKYEQYLSILTLDKKEIEKNLKKQGIEEEMKYSVFEYLLLSAAFNDNFFLELKQALFTFIKEKISISIESKQIFIGELNEERILDEEKFADFQYILRKQNMLPVPEPIPEHETPMQRKFRLRREQVKEAKQRMAQKNGDIVTLKDSISSLICLNIGVTYENFGELSIFAFKELLARAQKKYKYDLDLRLIAAGADPKKIKPKDWFGKLDN